MTPEEMTVIAKAQTAALEDQIETNKRQSQQMKAQFDVALKRLDDYIRHLKTDGQKN